MSLRYIVSPVTVQGHASDYEVLSLQHPINHCWSPFLLSSCLSSSGIISSSLLHCLHSICCCSTSIWLSLAQIHSIIITTIYLGIWICLDCFYHSGTSLILTLLIHSTSIGPWDESILTSPMTNCLTWAFTYRLTPPPFRYLQHYDCAFMNANLDSAPMNSLEVVHILAFFSFYFRETYYPCVIVHWFNYVGEMPDVDTGMWLVYLQFSQCHQCGISIIHIGTIYQVAHLIPIYGKHFIPPHLLSHYSYDSFQLFHVNKYIDNHAFEIAL